MNDLHDALNDDNVNLLATTVRANPGRNGAWSFGYALDKNKHACAMWLYVNDDNCKYCIHPSALLKNIVNRDVFALMCAWARIIPEAQFTRTDGRRYNIVDYALQYNHQNSANALIGLGYAPVGSNVKHELVVAHTNCRRAALIVYVVLHRRCRFPKDVARLVARAIIETRCYY